MALFETFSSIFFVFIFLPHTSTSLETCNPSSCPGSTVTVQFPFSLINNQTSNRCGYPGFNISCTNNQTTLNLPKSGQFIILEIDYPDQNIWITDPDNCMPQRFLNGFNITGTVFDTALELTNFTLLNCSYSSGLSRSKVPCLSGDNYTVSAVTTSSYQQSAPITSCSVMTTVLAPFSWPYGLTNEVQLAWSEPDCRSCEGQGGTCGFTSNTGLDVGCSVSVSDGSTSNKSGLPRAAKYGIAIGAGIPGLLCLVGLSCFVCGKVRDYGLRRRRQPNTELSTSINPHPVIVVMGLDEPTIEKFPKTLLGESRRLPKPSDNVCPICLSEYQPKETLRTIPECNHYFHANCIDEWLKMNATCPLCRNSPDESSIASSPSSSLSSSSSPSSSSL